MNLHKKALSLSSLIVCVSIMILILSSCPSPVGIFSEIAVYVGNSEISSGKLYDFGSVYLNSSTEVDFTIKNLGSDPLTLRKTGGKAVAIEGTGAAAFAVDSQPGLTIAGGTSVSFTVIFSPSSLGAISASIKIASSDLDEEMYTVKIAGTGSAVPIPDISVRYGTTAVLNEGTVDIGNQLVDTEGAGRIFTIENAGTADLTLTGETTVYLGGTDASMFVLSDPLPADTIAPDDSEQFTLTFSPTSIGEKSITVNIPNDDPDESEFSFTVTATADAQPEPRITVKKDSSTIPAGTEYNIGSVVLPGSIDGVLFTVQNTGEAALDLTGTPTVSIGGTNPDDFSVDPTPVPSSTITPDDFTTFGLSFTPVAEGTKRATIAISNNSANAGGYYFTVVGTATEVAEPEINVKQGGVNVPTGTGIDFGTLVNNTSSGDYTFIIENNGTETLTLTNTPVVEITGLNANEFSLQQPPVSLVDAGGNTAFTVSFNPVTIGEKSASLRIENDDSDEPIYTILLEGNSIAEPAPEIAVSTDSVGFIESGGDFSFGEVVVADSTSVKFTISNSGTAELLLSGDPRVSVVGAGSSAFFVSQPGSSVSQGGSTDFWITFEPDEAVDFTAAAIIQNNSDIGSFQINLSGSGLAAGTVSAPVFTPPAGYYQAALSVTMTTTSPGATIHYTTDGVTMPTDASTTYGGTAIAITSDETTIKAIALNRPEYNDSAITTGTYIIDLVNPSVAVNGGINGVTFNESTPMISGTATDNKAIDKVEVKIDSGEYSGHSTAYDTATLTYDAEFTSAAWEYTFTETPDDNYTVTIRVTDMSGRTATTTITFTIATVATWDTTSRWDISLWGP